MQSRIRITGIPATITGNKTFIGEEFIVEHIDATDGHYIAKFGNTNRGLVYLTTEVSGGDEYPQLEMHWNPTGWTKPSYPYGNYGIYWTPKAIAFMNNEGVQVGSISTAYTGNHFRILSHSSKNLEVQLSDDAGANKISIIDSGSNEVAFVNSDGDFSCDGKFGMASVTPQAQQAHIANPTDLATCISVLTTLLADLEGFGLHATS